MLLAISDIDADMGEASLGTRAKGKFMWRHACRFLSSQTTAALCASDTRSEPNFSFSPRAPAVCFRTGRNAISRFT
jgi:hypothetical protein